MFFLSCVGFLKLTEEIFELKVLRVSEAACLDMWRESEEKLFLFYLAILPTEGINHKRISAFLKYRNISFQVFKVSCLLKSSILYIGLLRASHWFIFLRSYSNKLQRLGTETG